MSASFDKKKIFYENDMLTTKKCIKTPFLDKNNKKLFKRGYKLC